MARVTIGELSLELREDNTLEITVEVDGTYDAGTVVSLWDVERAIQFLKGP